MSKVIVAVVATLTMGLAGTGFALHQQIKANGRLDSRVAELTGDLDRAHKEVEYRDGLAKALDQINAGLTANREANAAALSKTEQAIRSIKPTKKDSHESINCLRTAVPANLDRLFRGVAAESGNPVGDGAR